MKGDNSCHTDWHQKPAEEEGTPPQKQAEEEADHFPVLRGLFV